MNTALDAADHGVLHREGRDPLPRAHRRAPRASRSAAFDLPRGRAASRHRRPASVPRCTSGERPSRRATAQVVLETEGVTKRFAGITAVDDVSIELHEGEILGHDRAERRGQDHAVRPRLGVPRARRRHGSCSAAATSRGLRPQARARLGLARSFQDARLFGDAHRAPDALRRARRRARALRPGRGGAAPPDTSRGPSAGSAGVPTSSSR